MPTMKNRAVLCLAGASVLLLGASPAGAQESDEDIVVTARRIEERLQDIPLSVTVLNARALLDAQIAGTEDLDQVTPSLQFATVAPLSGNNAAAQVFIRGIGQTDPTAGVDPGVGLYIDDVYMGSAVGGVMDFRDIANVQVLRGPQGTLFGRNTVGGAILLTTQEPGNEFAGSATVTLGDDNLRQALFTLDAPLGDRVRSRWTYGRKVRDGYVTRAADGQDLGDDNTYTLTGKVVIEPADNVRISLRGDYTNEDENGTPLVFAAINESAAFVRAVSFNAGCPGMASVASPVPMVDDPRCANDYWNDGPFVANGTFPVESTLENWGVSAVLDWRLSDRVSLKSISAARALNWHGNRDADNTPFPILHTNYDSSGEQYSQELQLTYASDPLTVVGGLYYFKSNTDDYLLVTLAPPSAPTGTTDLNGNVITNENWAAFAQATYDITDALSVTAGVRYTEESKSSLPSQYNLANPANVYVLHQTFSRDFSATTGSASIQYRWNPGLMTYASWSQGFKSGGFNSRFNAPVPADAASGNPALNPPAFDQETAESYEIGVKIDPAPGMRLNFAAFSTQYEDIQLTYRFGVAPYTFNAGVATIAGVEGEYHYAPNEIWAFDANFSYLDDGFDEIAAITYAGAPPTSVPVNANSQLPYVPEWQGSASVEYRLPLPAAFAVTTRAEVVFVGAQFFDTGNTLEIAQNEDITTFNLGFMLQQSGEPWRLRLGLKNLTDEIYPIAGNSSLSTSSGYAEIAYNRGREAILSLSTQF